MKGAQEEGEGKRFSHGRQTYELHVGVLALLQGVELRGKMGQGRGRGIREERKCKKVVKHRTPSRRTSLTALSSMGNETPVATWRRVLAPMSTPVYNVGERRGTKREGQGKAVLAFSAQGRPIQGQRGSRAALRPPACHPTPTSALRISFFSSSSAVSGGGAFSLVTNLS